MNLLLSIYAGGVARSKTLVFDWQLTVSVLRSTYS